MEYEDKLDIEETPETDRLDRKLAVSGVARRLGECDGDRDTVVNDKSRSVLMAIGVALTGAKCTGSSSGLRDESGGWLRCFSRKGTSLEENGVWADRQSRCEGSMGKIMNGKW